MVGEYPASLAQDSGCFAPVNTWLDGGNGYRAVSSGWGGDAGAMDSPRGDRVVRQELNIEEVPKRETWNY